MIDVLPNLWKNKVEDEEKERAKKRVAVKIMYRPQYHGHAQECFRRNIGEPDGTISMHQSLGFTRIGEEERRDGEAIALHKTHICPPCPSLKFFAHREKQLKCSRRLESGVDEE